MTRPHILLLDEPTNALDPESIDALAKAVNEYEGGMVLVSHDMRLISQVAKEIWICDSKKITPYKGDIQSFKLAVRAQLGLDDGNKQVKSLRGDFSVKIKEGEAPKAKAASVRKPKLEVVVPPKKKVQATLTSTKLVVDDDDATATTAVTNSSMQSADTNSSFALVAEGAPARSRYIPPHLRKKMQEQQESS